MTSSHSERDCFERLRDEIRIHACCALFDLALASTNTYLSIRKEIRPRDNTPQKEPSMANVLSTGAWLSAPTKKPSFFARLLPLISKRVSGMRTVWSTVRHGKLRDAERQIERISRWPVTWSRSSSCDGASRPLCEEVRRSGRNPAARILRGVPITSFGARVFGANPNARTWIRVRRHGQARWHRPE